MHLKTTTNIGCSGERCTLWKKQVQSGLCWSLLCYPRLLPKMLVILLLNCLITMRLNFCYIFFKEQLMTLISSAKEHGIEFIYAISPGLDITFSNQKEVSTLKRKLDQVMPIYSILNSINLYL